MNINLRRDDRFIYLKGEIPQDVINKITQHYEGKWYENHQAYRIHAKYEASFKTFMSRYYADILIQENTLGLSNAPPTATNTPVQVEGTLTLEAVATVIQTIMSPLEQNTQQLMNEAKATDRNIQSLRNSLGSTNESITLVGRNLDRSQNDIIFIKSRQTELEERLQVKINELETKLANAQPVIVQITQGETITKVDVGVQHKKFVLLCNLMDSLPRDERNVLMVGPAGSGKTTAAKMYAKALGLPFAFNGAIDTEYKLSGFFDAQGRIVSTAFREIWVKGGVYLFDEFTASMASAIMAFNGALANGIMAFPDGLIERHENCYVLAGANTWGFGGDMKYIGNSKIDAASLDRFSKLMWDYDEDFELALCSNSEWCKVVQRTRALANEAKAQVVISPRASIRGTAMVNKGKLTRQQIVDAVFGDLQSLSAWSSFNAHVLRFVANEPIPKVITKDDGLWPDKIPGTGFQIKLYLWNYNHKSIDTKRVIKELGASLLTEEIEQADPDAWNVKHVPFTCTNPNWSTIISSAKSIHGIEILTRP